MPYVPMWLKITSFIHVRYNKLTMLRITPYLLSLSLLACGQAKPVPTTKIEVKKSADEDNLLFSLASELIANPSTQAEKDKNTIINYVMDQGIEVESTPSGLYYQMIESGNGDIAKWGDWVSVNYKGYTLDGEVFDTSYKRGKPMEFYIGNMVDGWNEGLELMRPGAKALFLIPSALAYGEKGFPDKIPPYTVLAFELELLTVTQK